MSYIPERALLVEQTAKGAWRTRLAGRKARAGAPEAVTAQPSDYAAAMADAMTRSRRTGLPVVVKPLDGVVRWPSLADLKQRESAPLRRRTLDDLLPPYNGGNRG